MGGASRELLDPCPKCGVGHTQECPCPPIDSQGHKVKTGNEPIDLRGLGQDRRRPMVGLVGDPRKADTWLATMAQSKKQLETLGKGPLSSLLNLITHLGRCLGWAIHKTKGAGGFPDLIMVRERIIYVLVHEVDYSISSPNVTFAYKEANEWYEEVRRAWLNTLRQAASNDVYSWTGDDWPGEIGKVLEGDLKGAL